MPDILEEIERLSESMAKAADGLWDPGDIATGGHPSVSFPLRDKRKERRTKIGDRLWIEEQAKDITDAEIEKMAEQCPETKLALFSNVPRKCKIEKQSLIDSSHSAIYWCAGEKFIRRELEPKRLAKTERLTGFSIEDNIEELNESLPIPTRKCKIRLKEVEQLQIKLKSCYCGQQKGNPNA